MYRIEYSTFGEVFRSRQAYASVEDAEADVPVILDCRYCDWARVVPAIALPAEKREERATMATRVQTYGYTLAQLQSALDTVLVAQSDLRGPGRGPTPVDAAADELARAAEAVRRLAAIAKAAPPAAGA